MSKTRQASQLSRPNAAPKRCSSLRARRMVTKGVMLSIDDVGRWRPFRLRIPYRRQRWCRAVLGLPCGRSGQIDAQIRRHVVHDPLAAKPLKGAAKPIRELAIDLKDPTPGRQPWRSP
jgi:hypothetical protein